jgi:hypothetical protein
MDNLPNEKLTIVDDNNGYLNEPDVDHQHTPIMVDDDHETYHNEEPEMMEYQHETPLFEEHIIPHPQPIVSVQTDNTWIYASIAIAAIFIFFMLQRK